MTNCAKYKSNEYKFAQAYRYIYTIILTSANLKISWACLEDFRYFKVCMYVIYYISGGSQNMVEVIVHSIIYEFLK